MPDYRLMGYVNQQHSIFGHERLRTMCPQHVHLHNIISLVYLRPHLCSHGNCGEKYAINYTSVPQLHVLLGNGTNSKQSQNLLPSRHKSMMQRYGTHSYLILGTCTQGYGTLSVFSNAKLGILQSKHPKWKNLHTLIHSICIWYIPVHIQQFILKGRYLSGSAFCNFKVPEQALGGIPYGTAA